MQAADYKILGIPIGFINRTITRGRNREADEDYSKEETRWRTECNAIRAKNQKSLDAHQKLVRESPEYREFREALSYWHENSDLLERAFSQSEQLWRDQKETYEQEARAEGHLLANLRADLNAGHSDAIEAAASIAIKVSRFQHDEPVVHYDSESKILLVEYSLPDFERVRISQSTGNRPISAKRLAALREQACFGLVIRACFDLAHMLQGAPVDALAMNSTVTFYDPANGHLRTETVGSIFVRPEEILNLNIAKADAKAVFKSLKGVSAGGFTTYSPVAPIYTHNKSDNRIVEGRSVLSAVAENANLAAMHWEDFEHLIRELFEREFASNGGEVKVTRASHDSGVDAIAFDPDPIRGGKIVIQAKRYVNTVDASAVRDLFGTVQSEGANKGILITTSGYGPESYNFAKGKPITLLNGENLLWLMQKHGYQFSIDLDAARKLLKERGWL